MALFKFGEEMIALQEAVGTLAATSCGCYMTNSSCGGSRDFSSGSSSTQACAQSVLSAQSPTHKQSCASS